MKKSNSPHYRKNSLVIQVRKFRGLSFSVRIKRLCQAKSPKEISPPKRTTPAAAKTPAPPGNYFITLLHHGKKRLFAERPKV